jgi:hypothetical protein
MDEMKIENPNFAATATAYRQWAADPARRAAERAMHPCASKGNVRSLASIVQRDGGRAPSRTARWNRHRLAARSVFDGRDEAIDYQHPFVHREPSNSAPGWITKVASHGVLGNDHPRIAEVYPVVVVGTHLIRDRIAITFIAALVTFAVRDAVENGALIPRLFTAIRSVYW